MSASDIMSHELHCEATSACKEEDQENLGPFWRGASCGVRLPGDARAVDIIMSAQRFAQ